MAEARTRRLEERAGLQASIPEAVTLRDRVRWGPIWAGTVLTLAIGLVLIAIGFTAGLLTISVNSLAAIRSFSFGIVIWIGVSLIISLFFGSYIASRLMPVDTRRIGIIHGVMVWALILVIADILLILIAGVTAVLVGAGIATLAITVANLFAAARLTAISVGWFILWVVIALITAVLGGYLGMVSNQTVAAK